MFHYFRGSKHTKFKGKYSYHRYEVCGLANSSMGNSNSQAVHKRADGHQSWNIQFPRDPLAIQNVKTFQNNVLLECSPDQQLRVTDKGAILLNGGTLSGRRQIMSLVESFIKHDQVCTDFELRGCYCVYSKGDQIHTVYSRI